MAGSNLEDIRAKVSSAGDTLRRTEDACRELSAALEKVDAVLAESEPLLAASKVKEPEEVVRLRQEDALLQWLRWYQTVREVEGMCKDALEKSRLSDAKTHFEQMRQIQSSLANSECSKLREFCDACLSSLRSLAAVKLSARLERDLAALNFPSCVLGDEVGSTAMMAANAGEREAAAHGVRANFILMSDLFGDAEGDSSSSPSSPSEILLEPLRKRFVYHFTGNRKTNNPVRPEWFLQQIKLWLRNGGRLLEQCGLLGTPAETGAAVARQIALFKRGLFALASDKLGHDLEAASLIQDDVLLSHFIDEVLVFTKDPVVAEMARGVGNTDCLPINVLSRDGIFQRWLSLERKYAFEKMDALLLEEDGWQSSAADPDLSRCVDAFVTLLQSLVGRFKPVREPRIKLRFVSLLLDLLEDFRLRLVKVMREQSEGGGLLPRAGEVSGGSDTFALALNSAQHLADTLESWQELPLFLHLAYLQRESAQGSEATASSQLLFSGFIESFGFVVSEWTAQAAELILYEVRARSQAYRRRVPWSELPMPDEDDEDEENLLDEPSAEMLGMLQSLSSSLTSFCHRLKPKLVAKVVDKVSWMLSEFLLQDVILANEFSPGGVRCLRRDLRVGVRPVLGQFGVVESNSRLREATDLLNVAPGSALLLLEALADTVDVAECRGILREHGVRQLSGSLAQQILGRRCDLAELRS